MMENDRALLAEILNDCLEAIEAGASVEDCLARYPEHAQTLADLLRLGGEVKQVSLPAPTPEMLAAGERRLIEVAAQSPARLARARRTRLPSLVERLVASRRAWPRWVLPAAALSGGLALLFACVVLVLLGGGLAWRSLRDSETTPGLPPAVVSQDDHESAPSPEPTATEGLTRDVSPLPEPTAAQGVAQNVSPLPQPTALPAEVRLPDAAHAVYLPLAVSPLSAHLAMLDGQRGVVEVQGVDGNWSAAVGQQTVAAGARVRTGALSAVAVRFYDGSAAYLGPDTELSIDALGQDPGDGSRLVELTQWGGETDHDVAPAAGAAGRYQVHTPSGSGEARGTFFHMSVTPALVRFVVDEGAVAVSHLDVIVVVIAGQATTVHAGMPPDSPFFRVNGEGEVEATGATWRVAGQNLETDEATVIVGNPQVGDWVSVDGHLLADGTRVADRIVLLRRAPANRFTLSGEVEAIGAALWTVAGQTIAVTETTVIDEGIVVGDRVRVDGVIDGPAGGALEAERISLIDARGEPFHFVGVVQETAGDHWVVSGISVTVDAKTVIDGDLVVGDVARVRGVFVDQEGGIWLARSIRRLAREEHQFEFVGLVERIDPWVISGVPIETRMWTEIKDEIEIGDLVEVKGRILPDGTWLAEEIELADDDHDLSFEFVGRVDRTGPWVVDGISLTVTSRTEIKGEIKVGDRVQVEGRIQPGGAWLATEIKLVRARPGRGCMHFTSLVVRVSPGRVVLQNGAVIPLHGAVSIEGELAVNSVILFYICVDDDGEMTIASIIVIAHIQPAPPSHRPPSGDDDDDDDDDHDDGDDRDQDDDRDHGDGGGSPIVVSGNNQTRTFTCDGNSVVITGNSNTITLSGRCGPVTIRGNNNWVSIRSATSVTDTGNNNTIVGP
ncbi:MAG: DUF3060 domain-containing protein [Anaerolineae bacterium]|nr:DUF3060 domain-containing protein [Anaerolineae bacterium]